MIPSVSSHATKKRNANHLALLKFTIIMHYDKTEDKPYPLTTTIKAHSLSLRNPQLKFLVRGDNGTFVKYGIDVQEDQVSANGLSAFDLIEYGLDSNDAEVEYIKDGVPTKEKCAPSLITVSTCAHRLNI